ncbi:MAG: DUF4079 family protein [Archaeoglobaceae archaeon]
MSYLPFIHPVVAVVTVLLCYINAAMGLSRLAPRVGVLRFNRTVHINVGRTFMVFLYLNFILGLVGINALGHEPFTTPHAYLGAFLVVLFTVGAILAHMILKGKTGYRKIHGRIMLVGAALLILQILGGIWNLRIFLGLF